MKNISLLTCAIGLSFVLMGCNSEEPELGEKENVGYFVTVFNQSVDYTCEQKRYTLNDTGKFECDSFPIAFYIKNTKLGEISRIHQDGYVYAQDIVVLEELTPTYTSKGNMGFLSVK